MTLQPWDLVLFCSFMKEKNFRVGLLAEYYGNMLTDRQREAIELYYDEDLSLQEISEHVNITRQGVRDLIVRGEKTLFELEEKLELTLIFAEFKDKLESLQTEIAAIGNLNARRFNSREISERARTIMSGLDELKNMI